VDSGNGAHARYWFAEGVPNSPEVTALIKTVQNIINDNFSTIKIKLDTKVYDAPRVVRIPGTVARKGENLPSNPHRVSRILRSFDPSDRLTVETLEKFVKSFPDQTKPLIAQAHRHLIEYPKDEQLYRNLNKIARERIHDWVPDLFAGIVRTHGEGYRIASDDVGRDLQEDICILPNGAIKDFGVHDLGDETEGRRTPVSLVAEFLTNGNKRLAAEKLSLVLNVEMDPFTGNPLIPPPLPVGELPAVMPAILLGGNQCDLAHPTLLSKLLSETVIPVTYTVDGLLAENTHTVLSGPAKSGKSTLVYRLVVHARMGLPFLGRTTKQCNVLWLALEERDYRFHRKIRKEIDDLLETEWAGLVTREEVLEELGKVRFYTIDNTKNDGPKRLPLGPEGAAKIREIILSDTSLPWIIVIEPVNRFHVDSGVTRNLNQLEYEQIEVINNIISNNEFTCTILSIKHDRKSPAGGIKNAANLMDNISGSVAQQGAPDAQIQFFGKSFYNFHGLSWLMVQSRDFGKVQIPVMSNGESWIAPPHDMSVPDFEEWLEQLASERGGKKKDPMLESKVLTALQDSSGGLSTNTLADMMNVSYDIMMRTTKKLLSEGHIVGGRVGQGWVYKIPPAVSMPINNLDDVL
jgi:hypothetical protein